VEYLGFALLGISALISLGSIVWFIVEGFLVSTKWGVLLILGNCLCGIPQLVFLITHWREAWPPFVSSVFGAVIPALVGYFIIFMENPQALMQYQ
jgi:hypothetical protein